MCLKILLHIKSLLLTCRTFLLVALIWSVLGYFVSRNHSYVSSNLTNESTEQAIQNTTQKLDTIRQEHALLGNNETMDAPYCYFETCKIIKCSCIPEHLDPGVVTRNFIENTFKVACGTNIAINLIFEKSTFPGNGLRKILLGTNLTISELTFADCYLRLNNKTFSSPKFRKTTKLHLVNNNISILKRATFRHLPNLQDLSIEENQIRHAEKNLLKDIIGLQRLRLEDAIRNVEVLRNITGGDVLRQVRILSLRYNYVPIIDSQLFSGVPNVVSLDLSDSHIKIVRANAFAPISKSVKKIIMNNNAITSLPEGLFDTIIQRNPDFSLTIDQNLWHCDCGLKWMQDMIKSHPNVVKKPLICSSPETNLDKSFLDADFCYETMTMNMNINVKTSTDVTSTTSILNTSLTTDYDATKTISINCDINEILPLNYSHQMFSTNDLEMPLRIHDFSATDLENGSILITLSKSDDVSLIWFANNARSNLASLKESIRCVSNVRNAYLLQNLLPKTSYTICSVDNLIFSPVNCLGLTTRSSFKCKAGVNTNLIIIVFVLSLIVVCFVSAIFMLVMVRRHPSMLRGSKRVVIVKRRTPNAMVLPKGLSSDTIESTNKNATPKIPRSLKENGYVALTPPVRNSIRKNSRTSSVRSDPSYISNIEPSLSRLNSWRRKRALYLNYEAEPPPLPPRQYRNIAQSLSTVSDTNEDVSEELICVV